MFTNIISYLKLNIILLTGWVKKTLVLSCSYCIFTKYWWILQILISQGSVATQLGCGVVFSNTLLQIFHRIRQWKKFWELVNTWQRFRQKFVAYFFRPPCIFGCTNGRRTAREEVRNQWHTLLSVGLLEITNTLHCPRFFTNKIMSYPAVFLVSCFNFSFSITLVD